MSASFTSPAVVIVYEPNRHFHRSYPINMHFSLVQYRQQQKKWSHLCGSQSSWTMWPMQKCGIIRLIWYCTKLSRLSLSLWFTFTGYENMMENIFVTNNQSVTIYMLDLFLCVCLSGHMEISREKVINLYENTERKNWKKRNQFPVLKIILKW